MKEFDVDKYDEELVKYIRSTSDRNAEIDSLSDEDISYLLTLWDEYLDILDLDEDEEDFDVDSDELYRYVTEMIASDEKSLDVDIETLISLIEMEEDFVDHLFEDEDKE
ncbi:hypothetical protein QYZ87_08580 [Porphyromonadaceae bacterium W3.11]|nr:hypothetical protein [Porphyromonadaceae bacterium W3.11]